MSESINELENELTESVDNLHSDLNNLISQFSNNISISSAKSFQSFQSKEEFEKKRIDLFNSFAAYNPNFIPNLVKNKQNEIIILKNENFIQILTKFYEKILKNFKNKEEIVSRRFSSTKSLSKYLDFFTNFIQSNLTSIQKWQTSFIQLSFSSNLSKSDLLELMNFVKSENRIQFPLKYLLNNFKYSNVAKRNKILSKTIERYRLDLQFNSFVSIPKNPQKLEEEAQRVSESCGIQFDLYSQDEQKFYYYSEKAFTDVFLSKIPVDYFDITAIEKSKDSNTVFEMINNAVISSTFLDNGLVESLKMLFEGTFVDMTKFFNDEIFKFNFKKEINKDLFATFMKLRFVKNKKALISIYNNCRSFVSLKSRLRSTQFSDEDVKTLFGQILHLILAFASKLVNKTFGELDINSILETALSLELRYEESKVKVINALLTIFDNTNDTSINSLVIELIDQKPFLFYEPLKSYERQFELNIDTLDVICQCLWLLINLQIMHEQINSAPRTYNDVYLLTNECVPISRFEVFPNLISVLAFYKKGPLISEEICESLSINHVRFNLYVTFSIWSTLLEEIKDFTNKCPLPFEKAQIPYLTSNVAPLFSNEIFDNFNEVENFFNNLKNDEDSFTFCRNFIFLNHYLLKLQNCYYKQHFLVPIYNSQMNTTIEIPSFELPSLKPEFLLDSNFKEQIETVFRKQYEFTKMLTLSVKFNNYQSDSLFVRNNFDLSKLDIDYSLLPFEENIQYHLNEFIAFTMFNCIDDFKIDKPLCDLMDNPSYSKYLKLYELAFLSQIENSFFHYNPIKEYFNSSSNYSPSDKLNPFIILSVSQCLSMPEDQIEDAYSLILHRIKICHLVRFESAIQYPIDQTFNSLAIGKLNFNGQLLADLVSEIHNHPYNKPEKAFEAFEEALTFRINVALLTTIFYLINSANNDQELINNTKEIWIELYKSRIPVGIDGDYLIKNRYLPKWVDLFMSNFKENAKFIFIHQLQVVDSKLAEQLIKYPERKTLEIIQKEFKKIAFIFASSILNSKENKLDDCTFENSVLHFSQTDLIEYSTSISSYISRSDSNPSSFHSDNNNITDDEIKCLIIKKQTNDIKDLNDSLGGKPSNQFVNSSTKPDFYNEKKALLKQQAYNPPPIDVSRQFNLELNYRFSKIISKLRDFLRTPDLNKDKLIHLCKKLGSYIDIFDNKSYSIQYKNKKPINAKIQTDAERFCSTYNSYIRNAINEFNTNQESIYLLGQMKRCYVDDQQSQWEVNSAAENTDKFLELNELRDELSTKSEEQKEEDVKTRENIKNEYESLLNDIQTLIDQEKEKFNAYNRKLVGNMKKSINSHIMPDESIEKELKTIPKSSDLNELNTSVKMNPSEEFPKSNFVSNQDANDEANNFDQFPKLGSGLQFPKFNPNQDPNDESNNFDQFPKLGSGLQFPKFDPNQGKSDNADEFPHFSVIKENCEKNQNSEAKNEEDEIEEPSPVQNENQGKVKFELPRNSPQENEVKESEETLFKFDHHIEFSPDSSRRHNRGEDEDDLLNDDYFECRRSRPPSSTTGFLISGGVSPRSLRPDEIRSSSKQEEANVKRFPSPPASTRPSISTPLRRRNVHNSIFSAYMNPAQIEKAENEIDLLKKEILRIRIVHCLNVKAMERHFNSKIASATQEYREINSALWNSKRNFEEEVRTITQKIEDFYSELNDYESEIEKTKAKIEKRKKETMQLIHWKHMNLQMCDSIQTQLKAFNTNSDNSLDVDVLTLIKKVEESRSELNELINETDAFEEELNRQIREPMEAIDNYKRRIAQTRGETARIRYQAQLKMKELLENQANEEEDVFEEEEEERNFEAKEVFRFKLNASDQQDSDEISQSLDISHNSTETNVVSEINEEVKKFLSLNRELIKSNEEIRKKIAEMEQMKEKLKPELRDSIEQLTSEPQAVPRPLISQTNERKIIRPTVSPKRNQQ